MRRGLATNGSHFERVFHKYGFTVFFQRRRAMKTTVEVSDALYRQVKSEAALRGRKLKDLVEEGVAARA
jgi:hypothetical protein